MLILPLMLEGEDRHRAKASTFQQCLPSRLWQGPEAAELLIAERINDCAGEEGRGRQRTDGGRAAKPACFQNIANKQ